MDKYRIKLSGGRIVGPLELKDIIELVYKKTLTGDEDVQSFPVGEWLPFYEFPELVKIIESDIQNVDEETFIANINNLEVTKSMLIKEPTELREFEYDHVDPLSGIILGEGTGNINIEQSENNNQKNTLVGSEQEDSLTEVANTNIAPFKESKDLDKTKINPDYQKYLAELKKEEEEKKEKQSKAKREVVKEEETIVDYENEATQFLSVEDIGVELEEALDVEEELKKEEEKKKSELKPKTEEKSKEAEVDDKSRLRRLMVLSAAALLFVYFFLDDEPQNIKKTLKKINIVEPEIIFPSRYEIPDPEKAKQNYQKGIEKLSTFKYSDMLEASKLFRESIMNQFNENKAMHRLIFVYSRLLRDSTTFIDDANSIFKLVLINKSKSLKDPFFASASAYFYYSIGKVNASLSVFDKYMTVRNAKPSAELFAVYLKALLKAGKFDVAKKINNRLVVVKKKNAFILEAIYEYYKATGENEERIKILKEARKQFPWSVYFLLEAGQILADNNELDALKVLIFDVNEKNVEGSRYYYAKYLTLKGIYNALNNRIDSAVKDFEKSLSLYRSQEIIEKLALLQKSGNNSADKLITDTRAYKELRLAERALRENDTKLAFRHALKASSLAPGLIDVKIFLAELQLKNGYIEDAIKQLDKLKKDNPSSAKVVFKLIDAYIEAYQFRNASDLIYGTVNMPGGQIHDFYKARAKFNLYKGNFNSAVGWLQRAVNENPIDDDTIYQLASLYIRGYKFIEAKNILKRAMDLDPSNVKYKIMYAKILYEVETSNSAIGYLYDVLKDFPDHPGILSEIGIYYYRSGQIKRYQDVKEKLLSLPKRSASLYRFLIESAKLDDDIEEKIKQQKNLLEIAPGELEVRMELATTLIDLQRYKEAKDELEAISERLKTYPRLNYSLAKLYLLVDDLEQAKKMAEKEMKDNPTVDDTYVLLGDIYKKEENFKESNNYYVKAMQINPKNTDAILGVAYIAFKSEQYELALDQYQKAIEVDPDRVEVYKLLGDAYRKLGQSQLAIKHYQEFLTRSPNSRYKNQIETYIRTMQ